MSEPYTYQHVDRYVLCGSFVREIDAQASGRMLQQSLSNVLQFGFPDIDEVSQARDVVEVPNARLAAAQRWSLSSAGCAGPFKVVFGLSPGRAAGLPREADAAEA